MTTYGNSARSKLPRGMKVAPQSYAKLEVAANDLRPMLPLVPGSKFKIDAWRVLEKTLPQAGYNFHVAELNNCAGFAVPEERLVVLRQDVYDGLFTDNVFSRSTVIHELNHIVLQHHVTLHRDAVLGRHAHYEDSEWQADSMTAAVLMPIEACRKAASAEELASMCGTSVTSARYRLETLEKRKVIQRKALFW